MDELIRDLEAGARVLDLGAGGGSFPYRSTKADVFAVDLDFPASAQPCAGRILADSRKLPFPSNVFHVVICNHTLEHFEQPQLALAEIDRILKPGGGLWIAVPNGFGFDDMLYRYIFEGGGHVNRFSLDTLVRMAEDKTALRALRYKRLHTGFVYLKPPDVEKLQYYPERAIRLSHLPPALLHRAIRWLNWGVRIIDRCIGTNLSVYGFGVVFRSRGGRHCPLPAGKELEQLPAERNVCYSCGAGIPKEDLQPLLERGWLLRSYDCPLCGTRNLYAG